MVIKQASKLMIITLVEEQFIVQDIKLSSLGMMCRTCFKGFAYITFMLRSKFWGQSGQKHQKFLSAI